MDSQGISIRTDDDELLDRVAADLGISPAELVEALMEVFGDDG